MNRWDALVEIVRSFNATGKSGLAFAAFVIFIVTPPLVFGVSAYFGADVMGLHAITQDLGP